MTADSLDLRSFARDVAAFLPGFQLEEELEPSDRPHYAHLAAEDGRVITLNVARERGKVYVSGSFPRDGHSSMGARDWGVIPHGGEEPHMQASTARGALVVARDILRRFLPAYSDLYAKALDKAAERAVQRRQTQDLAAELAALAGGEIREASSPDRPRVYLYRSDEYGDMDVTGPDSVTLTFRCGAETARRIARAYRGGLTAFNREGKEVRVTVPDSDTVLDPRD